MLFAVKPNGVGNPVGLRAVQKDWPLADGETFTIEIASVVATDAFALGGDERSVVPAGLAPIRLPLGLLKSRLKAEGVWDTYLTYMRGTNARFNALLETVWGGEPVTLNGGGFVNTLQGAGCTADQISRITARP